MFLFLHGVIMRSICNNLVGRFVLGCVFCIGVAMAGKDGEINQKVSKGMREKVSEPSTAKKMPSKPKATPKKSAANIAENPRPPKGKANKHGDFFVEIHEVETNLTHKVWYIPSNRQFVSMSIVFLDAGMKNVNGTHPALGLFTDMLTKGCGKLDQYEFLETIYDNGATISFASDIDHASITFWAPVSSYIVPLNLIPDMCLAPLLPNKLFEKARKDALNSFKGSLKDPATHLHEAMNAAFYPSEHPYRSSLTRIAEDIKAIKPQDIRNYLKLLCQGNAVVVILGPRENETEIVENVVKMLSAFPAKGTPVLTEYGPINTPEHDIHVQFDIPQTMISSRQPGFYTTDPNYYAKKVAFAIVARPSLDSLMYKNVRGDHGLAYYCYGKVCINRGDAALEFSAGTRNETTEQVKDIMKKTCTTVAKNGVSKSDFELIRKEIAGTLVVGLDSSASMVSFCVNNRILGRSLEETRNQLNMLKAVSLKDVNAACSMFGKEMRFVTVGGGGGNDGNIARSN
jgi:predicted Zn-dependent peptidase